MSAALASAKKRRAPGAELPKPPVQTNNSAAVQNAPQTTGLTLQQVITVINNRLLALENHVKENPGTGGDNSSVAPRSELSNDTQLSNDIIDEFNERFLILAQEVADLKDMLLSLQTYTMTVNKTLMEERIKILSDINTDDEQLKVSDTGIETLESSETEDN